METTFTIKLENTPVFEDKMIELNKIAKRIECQPLTFVYGEKSSKEVQTAYGKYIQYYIDVTITGEYPQYNDWSFVTQLDHENGLVKSTNETNHRHLMGDTTCHHCNSSRMRNVTYVIRNVETNEEKQVGGSCLKYYIPTKDITWLARFYDFLTDIQTGEFLDSGGRRETYHSLVNVVAWANLYVAEFGSYTAGETKCWVGAMITPNQYNSKERSGLLKKHSFDKCTVKANEMIEWARNVETTNDFMHNINHVSKHETINSKQFGFACAIASAYQRNKDNVARKKIEKAEAAVSEYIGTVKKREEFDFVLEKIVTTSGYYGDTHIHTFKQGNNKVVWFGTTRLLKANDDYVEVGDEVTVKATVKKHEMYRDAKQTIVQRVTLKK